MVPTRTIFFRDEVQALPVVWVPLLSNTEKADAKKLDHKEPLDNLLDPGFGVSLALSDEEERREEEEEEEQTPLMKQNHSLPS